MEITTVSPHLLDWDALERAEVAPGVTKRTIEGDGLSFVRIEIAAGTAAPKHAHVHEQFVHVESGTGSLETEQGSRRFGPGSVFHFPVHAWHAAVFETATVLIEVNLRH